MILFMQIPAFMQDYIQVLSGHVAELNYQLSLYTQVAMNAKQGLPELIKKFLANPDPDISALGTILDTLVARSENFTESLFLLTTSPAWKKPFIFITRIDLGCLKETYQTFAISLPLTLESILYGLVGLGVGALLGKLITFKRKHVPLKNSD